MASYSSVVGNPPSILSKSWLDWHNKLLNYRLSECPSARGTTYYFAQNGNDANNGLSTGSPKKTLSAAQTILNAAPSNANIALLFRRGDTWLYDGSNNVNLEITKNNVTIGAWSDPNISVENYTVNDPVISRFYKLYPTSTVWTLDTGTTYYVSETTFIGWVRNSGWVPMYGHPKCVIFHRYTTLANLRSATKPGFFWDSGTSRLYINTQANPNGTAYEACDARPADTTLIAGIHVNGATGCRIENIRVDGYSIIQNYGGSPPYPIYIEPGTDTACVVYRCKAYFGSWHMIGMAGGSGSGATFTVAECDAGLAINTGQTVYVSFQGNGGHETLYHRNTARFGALPVGDSWVSSGYDFYGHSNGNDLGLVVSYKNTTLDAGIYGCAYGNLYENTSTISGSTHKERIESCRTFVVGNQFISSAFPTSSTTSLPFGQKNQIAAFNRYDLKVTDRTNGSAISNIGHTAYAYVIGNIISIDGSSANGDVYLLAAANGGEKVMLLHNHIHFTMNGYSARIEGNFNKAAVGNWSAANNIFSVTQPVTLAWPGNIPSHVIDNDANSSLYNKSNAYVNFQKTYGSAGYSSDLSAVSLIRIPDIKSSPTNNDQLYRAGTPSPFGCTLHWDIEGKDMNINNPSIGPVSEYIPKSNGLVYNGTIYG
jgi:hypothetical protein